MTAIANCLTPVGSGFAPGDNAGRDGRIPAPSLCALDPMLSELDLHLFGEGRHYRIYDRLGAHLRREGTTSGVNFAVWAPSARAVSVIGDFNGWTDRDTGMQRRNDGGIWELFVPGIGVGNHYKFRITSHSGRQFDKCDPYGFAAEVPPRTANIVTDLTAYKWRDARWMEQRATSDFQRQPLSIYEVHLGSWKQRHENHNGWINYRELAHDLVEYCQKMGFTHLELMPVSEHPYTGSWGYQTVGYFAATSRYGSPADLMYLIDHCHQHGIGVIVDWVPAHFPKDGHGLGRFDGTAVYEHADPRQGEHPDWNTYIFNYGRNEVRNFLVANGLFWMDRYHVDGLRVDAVASMLYLDYSRQAGQWIPNRHGGRENLEAIHFLQEFNQQAHQQYPGVLTIAEESTAWGGVSRPVDAGGLGFNIKWNMGWMNDTLRYIRQSPIHRKFHHNEITFSMVYAWSENFLLPFSHDEVVHGKGSLIQQMPGDTWQKFANLRLLYSYLWFHPGKKLVFMGNELAMPREWNCDQPLPWELLDEPRHAGIQRTVADLNRLYSSEKPLHDLDFHPGGFEWIDCDNPRESTLTWLRKDEAGSFLVIACNFTPVVRENFRIGVPAEGMYGEIFNSDSEYYGGSNVGNPLGVRSEPVEFNRFLYSIPVTLPPLAAIVFRLNAELPGVTDSGSAGAEASTGNESRNIPGAKETPAKDNEHGEGAMSNGDE